MVRTRSIKDILSEHAFFAGLEPAYIELIVGCGLIKHFKKGEVLAKEGDDAMHFFVLMHGRLAVETFVPTTGSIVLETVENEIVGWSWLFPPYKWAFDVRAASDVSVIALDGACLRGKCEHDAKLGYTLMKRFARLMTRRLEVTRMRLLDVYGMKK